jgi:hypothetical protein
MLVPTIQILNTAGERTWETRSPARLEILGRFGAEDSSAKVMLHSSERFPNAQIGDELRIFLNGTTKFIGMVSELRRDSLSFPLVIRGARRPRRMYHSEARGLFINKAPTTVLKTLLDEATGPVPEYDGLPTSSRRIDRLDFQGLPLFYAIDLLARLAGNWLWWIDWEGKLRFIPSQGSCEHVWYFNRESMGLHPWFRDKSIKNVFRLHGGVVSGGEFERFFTEETSREQYGVVGETLYARPVVTAQAFEYLREAVLDQAPWPTYFRAVDRWDGDLTASFGERFQLRGDLPSGMQSGRTFRIAAEEITWNEKEFLVRYHLAEGKESATRYTRYLDHEASTGLFVQARLGAFELDLSALNSEAHLDP